MKENKYDNPAFFEQYSHMSRSVEGLSAAGEWHALEKMLPDFAGKRVLDLGCGFGWHCNYAAEHGAVQVVGTDLSEKMLAVAREKAVSPVIEYSRVAMEEIAYPANSFDVVLSSLAFHYVQSFALICEKVSTCLCTGGAFVFRLNTLCSQHMEAKIGTTTLTASIFTGRSTTIFARESDQLFFLGESITKYHKTLTTYLRTLLKSGFVITDLVEPQPTDEMIASVPGMQDELRRPMMLLVSAKKR